MGIRIHTNLQCDDREIKYTLIHTHHPYTRTHRTITTTKNNSFAAHDGERKITQRSLLNFILRVNDTNKKKFHIIQFAWFCCVCFIS